ncbi:MAG: hypothetical protein FJX74_17470, partial [Armatimonadetes bacterium]|nr:hypothetical protein [Armatimonadota bacterium]
MLCVTLAALIAPTGGEPAMAQTPEPATRPWPVSFALPLPDLRRYEGIPRFPTNMPASSVLRAAMQLIDEDLGLEWDGPVQGGLHMDQAQLLFMGVTGEAFAFLWFPKEGERPALDATLYWPDPRALYERSLGAAGFTCEVLVRPGLAGDLGQGQPFDAQTLKDRVLSCLVDEGLPVILADLPEPGSLMLVSGYEEDGDVLTGWRARGGSGDVLFDPGAKAEAHDWTGAAQLVVLLTGRQEPPTEQATMRDAVEQAVRLLRIRDAGPYHVGPATFEAWAEALLSDDPPDPRAAADTPPPSVTARRRWLICPTTWDLMERASYAVRFLERATALFPTAAGELGAASACMSAVGDLMVQAGQTVGGGQGPGEGWPKVDDPEA